MTDASTIDYYADSMFRFERLHPKWIESCAGYLRHVFGEAIEGKVFLDYAFGRGNWSLAARRAGAARAIAIDASESNVRRFTAYCRTQGISGIDILHGDVVKSPLDARADVLWIYGILPCIEDCNGFLAKLALMRRDDDSVALLYSYDRGSLRQAIVEMARRGVTYATEQAFGEDSYLFTPQARLRARDDLTAPLVNWLSARELRDLARRNGLAVRRQVSDFRRWTTGVQSSEFAPHHFVCGFAGDDAGPIVEPERPQAHDFAVIAAVADAVWAHARPAQRRNLALGLFNTHFSALPADGSVDSTVVEDFLFLMHAALRLNVPASALAEAAAPYYAAAMAAMVDAPREFSPDQLAVSPLARYLAGHTVRF
jgi:Methyltransferase domain